MMYSVRCFRCFLRKSRVKRRETTFFAVSVHHLLQFGRRLNCNITCGYIRKNPPGFPSEQFLFNRKFLLLNKKTRQEHITFPPHFCVSSFLRFCYLRFPASLSRDIALASSILLLWYSAMDCFWRSCSSARSSASLALLISISPGCSAEWTKTWTRLLIISAKPEPVTAVISSPVSVTIFVRCV